MSKSKPENPVAAVSPAHPTSGELRGIARILRGGLFRWHSDGALYKWPSTYYLRTSYRYDGITTDRVMTDGFRIARTKK